MQDTDCLAESECARVYRTCFDLCCGHCGSRTRMEGRLLHRFNLCWLLQLFQEAGVLPIKFRLVPKKKTQQKNSEPRGRAETRTVSTLIVGIILFNRGAPLLPPGTQLLRCQYCTCVLVKQVN
jgi:hypothetical protein